MTEKYRGVKMAKCDICGKGVTFGIKVSHSHRRTNRTWKPNVQRIKTVIDGTPQHIYACTRCIRTQNKEQKVQSA
ncbi:50S ribosomal protein L28 [Clostridia bacterium]|nr:50S ribosomal protein L28 [Clostridia bacterium]